MFQPFSGAFRILGDAITMIIPMLSTGMAHESLKDCIWVTGRKQWPTTPGLSRALQEKYTKNIQKWVDHAFPYPYDNPYQTSIGAHVGVPENGVESPPPPAPASCRFPLFFDVGTPPTYVTSIGESLPETLLVDVYTSLKNPPADKNCHFSIRNFSSKAHCWAPFLAAFQDGPNMSQPPKRPSRLPTWWRNPWPHASPSPRCPCWRSSSNSPSEAPHLEWEWEGWEGRSGGCKFINVHPMQQNRCYECLLYVVIILCCHLVFACHCYHYH